MTGKVLSLERAISAALIGFLAMSGCSVQFRGSAASSHSTSGVNSSSGLDAPVVISPATVVYTSGGSTLTITGTCNPGATVNMVGSSTQSVSCAGAVFSFTVSAIADNIYVYSLFQTSGTAFSHSTSLVWNRLSTGGGTPPPLTLSCNSGGAPFGGGDGSASNPYTLCTAAQLAMVGHYSSAYYVLLQDIDLNSVSFNPIGWGFSNSFWGVFDGGGHTISNFSYSDNTGGSVGLFSRVSSPGTIQNLNVTGVNVSGNGNVGGLIGSSPDSYDDAKILNTHVSGTVVGHSTNSSEGTGGLVGNLRGAIIDSDFSGTVTGQLNAGGLTGRADYFYILGSHSSVIVTCADSVPYGPCAGKVGGLVGYTDNAGSITDSYAAGSISSVGSGNGGLVGTADKGVFIQHSYSSATVSGALGTKMGGLVGSIGGVSTGGGVILDSYATSAASVSGASYVGGLVGFASKNTVISNSYAQNGVTATGNYVGGAAGMSGLGSIISESYSTGAVQGVNYVGGLSGSMNDFSMSSYPSNSVIFNSYSLSNVSGVQNVGGVTGSVAGLLANSYSTGAVTGSTVLGGLGGDVAVVVNSFTTNTGITWNSAWDITTSGQIYCVSSGGDQATCFHGANYLGSSAITWNRSPASTSGQGISYFAQPLYTYGGEVWWDSSWNAFVPFGSASLNPISSSIGINISAPSATSVSTLAAKSIYTVVFAGADSITFNDWDVTVTGTASATATVKHVSGSTYQVTLTNFTGVGTTGISLFAGTARDSSGALAPTASSSNNVNVNVAGNDCGVGAMGFPGGTGTMYDPFLICNVEQLTEIQFNLLANYKLIKNIDMSSAPNFFSINGTFLGTFDGSNKVISNWTYIGGSGNGFFNAIGAGGTALIENLGLENVAIDDSGGSVTGALVGKMEGGAILNSHVTETMTLSNGPSSWPAAASGMVGIAENGVIRNSYSSVSVTSNSTSTMPVGGLVGYSSGTLIQNSFASGNVVGCGNLGGAVGEAQGGASTFINSYATGDVSDNGCGNSAMVGGFIGFTASSAFTNSYATGTVTGGNQNWNTGIGGFAGYGNLNYYYKVHSTGTVYGAFNVGGLIGQAQSDTVLRSYSSAVVNPSAGPAFLAAQYVGGFTGYVSGGFFKDNYATGSATGYMGVGGFIGNNQHVHVMNSYATGAVYGSRINGSMVGINNSGNYTNSFATGLAMGGAPSRTFAGFTQAILPVLDLSSTWGSAPGHYVGCATDMTPSANWDPAIWFFPPNGGYPTIR